MSAVEEIFVEAISNPFKAQDAAKKMALCPNLTPDEIKILRCILQPWWDAETDARAMCRYLGALGAADGQKSAAHIRVVRIEVLCVRTVLFLIHEERKAAITSIVDDIERFTHQQDVDIHQLPADSAKYWRTGKEYFAIGSVVSAGYNASIATDGAADAAASCAAKAIAQDYKPDSPEWTAAHDHHLSVMADMIRSEIPVCPVGLP